MRGFLYLTTFFIFLITACTDPISLGGDVIGTESGAVEFIDTISLKTATIPSDSALTFRRIENGFFPNQTFMVGELDDPIFGTQRSTSYFSVGPNGRFPDLSDKRVDSVVLTLSLDTLGAFGDPTAVHDLELYTLSTPFEAIFDEIDNDSLYSNRALEHDPTPIVSQSIVVNHYDSIQINNFILDTLVNIPAELRLPLEKQEWIDLSVELSDTLVEQDDIYSIVPGYALKSVTPNNSMIGLDLLIDSGQSSFTGSFVRIYYWPTDTTRAIYLLPLGDYRHSYHTQDISGSQLESDAAQADPEFLYLQSLNGTDIEIGFENILNFSDKILNSAILELTIKREEGTRFDPPVGLFAFYNNEDNERVTIPVLGTIEDRTNMVDTEVYSFDLTDHLNLLQDDVITSTKLILTPNAKVQRPNRAIIYGPGSSDFPPILKAIITNL